MRQEVGNNTVSGPLGEEANGNKNDQAVAVTRGGKEFEPAVTLILVLQRDCLLDFFELDVDQLVIFVTLGMDICQHLLCLFQPALGDEPTGRLRDGPANCESVKEDKRNICNFCTHQMNTNWHREGTACRRQGTRQDQALFSMWLVPVYHASGQNVKHGPGVISVTYPKQHRLQSRIRYTTDCCRWRSKQRGVEGGPTR